MSQILTFAVIYWLLLGCAVLFEECSRGLMFSPDPEAVESYNALTRRDRVQAAAFGILVIPVLVLLVVLGGPVSAWLLWRRL